MTEILGVDYSATASADWDGLAAVLKNSGRQFVGRYAVNDKSPGGRGIAAAEYQAMTAAGIDVFLYWESSEGWMTGGFAAGVVAAVNAQNNITSAGMPHGTPVYFACDFDAAPEDQAAIDDCLRGCASVLGFERVGLYAGYHVLKRSMQNGTARWFCQTSAWSGGMVLGGIHLYQYAYNQYFAGTNCDLVRAYQEDFGQARKHTDAPPPPPIKYAAPEVPEWFARSVKQARPSDKDVDGVRWHVCRRNVEAVAKTYRYSRPDIKSPKAGPPVNVRDRVHIERVFTLVKPGKDGKPKRETWFVCGDGCFVFAGKFTPSIAIKPR